MTVRRRTTHAGCAACLWAAAWWGMPCGGHEPPRAAPKARFVQIRPIGDRYRVDVETPPATAAPTSDLKFGSEVRSGRLPSSEPIAWELDELAAAEAAPLSAVPEAADETSAAPLLPQPLQLVEPPDEPQALSDGPQAPPEDGPALSVPPANAGEPAPEAPAASSPAPESPAPSAAAVAPPGNRRIAGPAGPRRLAVLQAPSQGLGAVERQAQVHVVRGFDLGAKGSLLAAREEFLSALGVLVHALDAAGNTTFHATALAAGMTALDEADDFLPKGAVGSAPRSVIDVALAHDTPLFHDRTAPAVPPLVAVQRYYTYAQQQLSAAVEAQAAGSRALYGLGKTYTALSRETNPPVRAADSKAVVWHQAALLADSENYAAANDLGVLLARWGKLPESRELLQHSLSLAPRVETWQNLASVHRALGEEDLAQSAAAEAASLRARQPTQSAGPYRIQWVSPDAFGRAAPAPGMARQTRPQAK